MAWWNAIGGIFSGGKELAEVFVENKNENAERKHIETVADVNRDAASLAQFSAEFQARNNRTKWDSFVDGLNRLPRPLLTIVILSFFVLAPLDPVRFLQIAKAYELMPPGYWALISVVISFYFGGRMQLKAQDMTIRKDAVNAAKELIVMRKEFRALEHEEESEQSKIFESLPAKPENSVIKEWRETQNAKR